MQPKLKIVPVEELNKYNANTLMGTLGIRMTEVSEDFVRGEMQVAPATHQIYGLLHGGASVAFAESLGSLGAVLTVDPKQFHCVGVEINANHISSVRSGKVIGTARPLHLGRSTQVWEIRITTEDLKLVCVSRLTVAVIPARQR